MALDKERWDIRNSLMLLKLEPNLAVVHDVERPESPDDPRNITNDVFKSIARCVHTSAHNIPSRTLLGS